MAPVRRSWPRPGLPRRPAVVLALLAAAFVGISTTTGTGWPLVLVSLLVGVLAAGAVLPPLWLVRARITVRLPVDATIGTASRLTVTGRGSGTAVHFGDLAPGWNRLGSGTLPFTPRTRGVVDRVVVDLWSTAPLGLWSWRRREVLAVDTVMHVVPVRVAVDGIDLRQLHGAGDDLPRGVRTYLPGDDRRHVHWTATARTGELMVREVETTATRTLTLVAGLGADSRVEERAAWALSLGLEALELGFTVELVTLEASGPVVAAVATPAELGRRIARAVAGGLASPAGRPATDVVDVRDHLPLDARAVSSAGVPAAFTPAGRHR